jgi:subtilisin family serine protease
MRTTAIFCVLLALYVSANALAPLTFAEKEGIKDSYIVVFNDAVSLDLFGSDLAYFKTYQNVSFDYTYDRVLKGFAATLDKDQLMVARNHPRVKYIEQNQVVHAIQDCYVDPGHEPWGVTRVSERTIQLDGGYRTQYTNLGEGVDIYIIDTGILITHNDFGNRATFAFKATSSWPNTDDHGHGTHVTSTSAGKAYGIAKNAQLFAVKVLGGDGSGTTSGVIAGVNFAVSNRDQRNRPSVGNMSLGGGKSTALDQACNAASNAGVIMVVAAGNDNNNACNGSPSGASTVISVGATDVGADGNDNQKDVRSYFSNYGTCTHVFAPGSNILGAWIGGPSATRTISGTSMASPHVAGAAALLLGQTPSLSFAQVKSALTGDATMDQIDLQCTTTACRNSPNLMLFVGCE